MSSNAPQPTSDEDVSLLRETRRGSIYSSSSNSDFRLQFKDESPARRLRRMCSVAVVGWAVLVTALLVSAIVWVQHGGLPHRGHGPHRGGRPGHGPPHSSPPPPGPPTGKRNLVFMVSDGMGPASLSLTRSFRQHVDKLPYGDSLVLDKHFWGTSRTRSSSSLVTDSAAGATAFSCANKTYNGAIAMMPDYTPCGTVLEAAKLAGYTTGLVVTTDITDATPAAFSSHVITRSFMDQIATQQIGEGPLGRVVDLMFGGGRCRFLPSDAPGGCRIDDRDLTKVAQKDFGWTYASDRKAFDNYKQGENVKLPALGLFADNDFPFELDRRQQNDTYPSLSEMATTALRALEKATADTEQGFFIMIEASRIDHAGHFNDPAAQVHEVLEYDKAFKAVLDFIESTETETLLLATSDHETGGLGVALQEPGELPVYDWYPAKLAHVKHSAEFLAKKIGKHVADAKDESKKEFASWIRKEVVADGLHFDDVTDAEVAAIVEDPSTALVTLSAIISLRAHVGWSTHGHSAVDVNIYSSGGPGSEVVRGNVENTDIGLALQRYLDVDVEPITRELGEKMHPVDSFFSFSDSFDKGKTPPTEAGVPAWIGGTF